MELGSDEGAFAIRCDEGLEGRQWPDNSLVVMDAQLLAEGDVLVATGGQWGPFAVATEQRDSVPHGAPDLWEDVVEFSLTTRGPLVVGELVDREPFVEVVGEAGTFRVRVSARGRGLAVPSDEDGTLMDGPPLEHYLVQVWPADLADPEVISMATPDPEEALRARECVVLALPETRAGLDAAARIGRDVDRSDRCRTLTGETGAFSVSRTLAGTRRRLFSAFKHHINWSVSAPSWGFGSGGPGWDEVGGVSFGSGYEDHPDRLAGGGHVRVRLLEVQSPGRVVRGWNWVVGTYGQPLEQRSQGLARDIVETTTLVQSRTSNGEAETTVTIEQTGVPVEWVDDLRLWLTYQLALADAEDFGLR